MKSLGLIAAIGYNNELGIDNHLLWKIPEDLSFYKRMTMGKNIIMGRKTFESMPPKAFIGRKPIILTSHDIDSVCDVLCFDKFDNLLEYIYNTDEDFMVVGGAMVYELFIPYVDEMYLTEVAGEYIADTYFPYFDPNEFDKEEIGNFMDNDIPYVRNKYVRKKVK